MAVDDMDFEGEENVMPVGRQVITENIRVGHDDDDAYEFDIVDDTPEDDRGRQAMDDDDDDDDGDEVGQYSKRVQKRINKMTHRLNDERREKERLAREHAEAIKIAKSFYSRVQELENTLSWGADKLTEEAKSRLDYQHQIAQDKYRRAFESGDTDGVLEAQSELSQLAIERSRLDTQYKQPANQAPTRQPENNPVYSQVEPPQPQRPVDYKAQTWASQNPWFGKDDEMTSFAYGVHERLVRAGVDPTSDEYYEKVNRRMREVFPQNFSDTRPKKTGPVASVDRTTASKKATVTRSEAAIIKQLGITPEAYIAEKRKQERQHG